MKMKKNIIVAGAALLAVGSLSLGFSNLAVSAETTNLNGFEIAGASVRTVNPVGMRFITEVPESIKDSYTFGTLIIPKADLGEATLDINTAKALNIETSKWQEKKENKPYTYASVLGGVENGGSITDFPKSQYNAPIVARSYAKDGEGNVVDYTETVERSLAGVASMALADTTDEGKITVDTQRTFLNGICDYVLGADGFAMQNASIAGTGAKDLSILFDETNGNEGLTAIWSVVEGEAIELQYNQHGIATTMTVVGEGSVTLQATIGSFTETVTVTVAGPTALAQTKYYDMSANSDLTLDLATLGITGNVTKMTVAGTEVTPVVDGTTVKVTDVESVVGITDIYYKDVTIINNDTGANKAMKQVVIYTADAAYALDTVFVTQIISQATITAAGGSSLALQNILYNANSVSGNQYYGYYVLSDDITFTDGWGKTVNPTVMTSTNVRFNGVLDGLGHYIKNLSCATGTMVFGHLGSRSTIRNISVLEFANASTSNNGVALFGINYGGIIENIYIERAFNGAASTGNNGQFGFCRDNIGTIKNCIVYGTSAANGGNHYYVCKGNSTLNGVTGTVENCYAVVNSTGTTGQLYAGATAGVYLANSQTGALGAFYADTTVVNALAANGYNMRYWKFDSTAQTISMSANANDIK